MLLGGVNDSDADARRVARMLANLNAKVNVIALNPGPGIPYSTPSAERVASFQAIVRKSLPCFLRKPRGPGRVRGVRATKADGAWSRAG